MSLTTFNPLVSRFGYDQGRIQPKFVTPVHGDWLWCLGSDTPGRIYEFKGTDESRVSQSIDLTGVDRLIWTAQVRFPVLGADRAWFFHTGIPTFVSCLGMFAGDENAPGAVGRYREGTITEIQCATYRLTGSHNAKFGISVDALSAPMPPGEFEIPGVYLEKLVTGTVAAPFIFGRYPWPSMVGAPRGGGFRFSVADPDLLGWDTSTLNVTIGGIPAVVGGVVQSGWTGSFGGFAFFTLQSPGPGAAVNDILLFSIHRDADFGSGSSVTIQVSCDRVGGSTFSDSWSCTIEDFAPPVMLAAGARDIRVVRASFDEDIRLLGDGDTGDGLNADNWSVVAVPDGDHPVADVNVESVLFAASDVVDVVTDVAMSPGRDYEIRAQNIEDLHGNPIPSGTESAPFTAIDLPRPENRDFDLWSMVPATNRRRDATGDARRFIRILQEIVDLALYDIDRFPNIFNHQLAGQPWLDLILEDLGNPFSSFDDLTDLDKRRLVDVLVEIYRQKGTEVGIENAIRFFLGLDVDVQIPVIEGWVLTDEAVGTSIISGSSAPFPLFDGAELDVRIDGGGEQTVVFNSGDFVDITEATAEEVADVIQLALDAVVETENSEPFELADGETLSIQVDGGADQVVTFNTGDFVDITAATAVEVAAVIDTALTGGSSSALAGRVRIESDQHGPGVSIHVNGGTGNEALDFPTYIVFDGRGESDGDAVVISTYGVGPLSSVEITGGDANDVLNFDTDPVVGEGYELGVNTYLAPAGTFLLYSFIIVSPVPLTAQQRERVEFIANYMKPAHTHLIEVTEPAPEDIPDHVELGLSDLGENWDLH